MAKINFTKDELRVIQASLIMNDGYKLQDHIQETKKDDSEWYKIWEEALEKINAVLNKELE
jgi:hypothetical protein